MKQLHIILRKYNFFFVKIMRLLYKKSKELFAEQWGNQDVISHYWVDNRFCIEKIYG